MIIVLRPHTSRNLIEEVISEVAKLGYEPAPIHGATQTIVAAIGDESTHQNLESLTALPQVERVLRVQKRFKLASRESQSTDSVVDVDGVKIGGGHFAMMAGPCSIESYEQTLASAKAVKAAGGSMLRGGAYKPRTSPYAFQGLGLEGLRILRAVGDEVGLPVTTELMDVRDLQDVIDHVDMIWIGARNMQNFNLLSAVGSSGKPIMLKRGIAATIEELLMASEYIANGGCDELILCERGIRTFERATRFTLDVSAIPVLKAETHLPIIVDPSHAAGKRSLVAPLSLIHI